MADSAADEQPTCAGTRRPDSGPMTDWLAYDPIAKRYDEVWGPRFEAVAELVWRRVAPAPGAVVLDVGTGTGIVPHVLARRPDSVAVLIGCDRSRDMLQVARSRTASLDVVAADAVALPFRDSAFDVVTASFVMSHVADYRAALVEARRVLRPGGALAITSWAAGEDEPSRVWSRLLAGMVPADELEAAFARLAPSMSVFDNAAGVESALTEAGFVAVSVGAHAIESRLSADQFIADRELTSGSRYARHLLDPSEWELLRRRAHDELDERFGARFTFSRGALVGVGRKG